MSDNIYDVGGRRLIDIAKAAQRSGKSPRTLRRYVAAGRLRVFYEEGKRPGMSKALFMPGDITALAT